MKYLWQKSYQIKGWCELVGLDWEPGSVMISEISGKKLIKWPKSSLKNSIKWHKRMLDPRVDLTIYDKMLLKLVFK